MKYLLALFLLVLSACGGNKEVPAKPEQTTLKVALAYKPRSYDPHQKTDSATLAVTKQIYSNLFTLDGKGGVKPELVDSYKVEDDGSIFIELKKGVYFHDGSEMKAEDVKKSLERNFNAAVSKVMVNAIESIEVLGDYSLKIIQHNAPSILLHNLAHSSVAIVKEVPKNEQGIDLVGTGPYKIKDWALTERITLERFDKFFKEEPVMKEIVFQTVPEASNRLIGLETKEIDIAYDIAAKDIQGIKKNSDLKVINEVSLGSDFVTINTKRITDKRVRQAIEYAIDKKALVEAVYEGAGTQAKSILSPTVFGYDKNTPTREHNKEKALELLKEAGVENLTLQLYIYDEASRQQMAQIIQANLKEVGINVEINVLEVSSFLQYTGSGKHDMLIGLWYVSTGDADYAFYPLLHSSSAGPIGNRSFYDNIEFDKLIESARKSNSTNERIEDYKKAQEILSDEVPLFPISYKINTIGMQKNIDNFIFNTNGNHELYKVSIKK